MLHQSQQAHPVKTGFFKKYALPTVYQAKKGRSIANAAAF